jgi:hypothetical protein
VDLRWDDNSAVEDGYEVWVQDVVPNSDCDAGCYTNVFDYPAAGLPADAESFTCGEECVSRTVYVKALKDGGTSDSSNHVRVP